MRALPRERAHSILKFSPSVAPPTLHKLPVAVCAGSEGQQLQALGAGLEGARHAGRDAYGVEYVQLDDLLLELGAARTGEHDVHLLGAVVPVPERLALAGLDAVVAEARLLRSKLVLCEARLLDLADPELLGRVLDVAQVLQRERRCHDR